MAMTGERSRSVQLPHKNKNKKKRKKKRKCSVVTNRADLGAQNQLLTPHLLMETIEGGCL